MGPKKVFIDLFCGAGGTSTGAQMAFDDLGLEMDLTAVNHWDTALSTHASNHPTGTHILDEIEDINPHDHWKPGDMDMLWASPECPHHSVARGGKPVSDQKRSTGKFVVEFARAGRPREICIENVPEYMRWGPVIGGKPCKKREGEYFRQFLAAFADEGYHVEHRVLCCADYGDPTIRKRLFIRGALDGPPVWPTPTHTPEQHIPAYRIIDWDDLGKSIYDRPKPLCENTMRRIRVGLERYGLLPFVVPQQSGHVAWDITRPLPAITCKGAEAVAQPFLIQLKGTGITRDIASPLAAITTSGNTQMLATPFIVRLMGQSNSESILKPLSAVTNGNHHALAVPYIVKYFGTSHAGPVTRPLDTLTCNDRFALTSPIFAEGDDGSVYLIDVYYRMLKPLELARATGFPDDYIFQGTTEKDIKRQIGNAVPVHMSRALVKAAMSGETYVN